jgi:hypothetical protein
MTARKKEIREKKKKWLSTALNEAPEKLIREKTMNKLNLHRHHAYAHKKDKNNTDIQQ